MNSNVDTPRVAVLMSRVRVEEKLLLAALDARGIAYELIDDRQACCGETVYDLLIVDERSEAVDFPLVFESFSGEVYRVFNSGAKAAFFGDENFHLSVPFRCSQIAGQL